MLRRCWGGRLRSGAFLTGCCCWLKSVGRYWDWERSIILAPFVVDGLAIVLLWFSLQDLVFLAVSGLIFLGSSVSKEVCNVLFILLAIDRNDKTGRGVAHFSHVFVDRIALQGTFEWFQHCLQLFRPLGDRRVQPHLHGICAWVQDHRHTVVQKGELFVGIGRDDGVAVQFLILVIFRAFIFHAVPQPRKTHQLAVGAFYEVRDLLLRVGSFFQPFIKALCDDYAAFPHFHGSPHRLGSREAVIPAIDCA